MPIPHRYTTERTRYRNLLLVTVLVLAMAQFAIIKRATWVNRRHEFTVRARRLATVPRVNGLDWLGDDALMVVVAPAIGARYCTAFRVDLATRAHSPVTFASPIPRASGEICASPDGGEVVWFMPWPLVRMERVDGSGGDWYFDQIHRIALMTGAPKFYWMLDGSGFCLVTDLLSPQPGARSTQVAIWDRNRPGPCSVAKTVTNTGYESFAFRSKNDVRVAHIPLTGGVRVTTYATSLTQPESLHRLAQFTLPGEMPQWHWDGGLSPDGEHVAVITIVRDRQPIYVSLLRHLHIPVRWAPHARQVLWVCSFMGRNVHEVAHVDFAPAGARSMAQPQISRVRWSPDGKRIARLYGDGVYVVHAD